MEGADFSGYATKAGLKCSDGRVIKPEAFQHMNGQQVPLVYQHGHNDINNVLGHVFLEARKDGMYAWGFFNDTVQGINAKKMVLHKDLRAMSIWANGLVEKLVAGAKAVLHGNIKEVSLVLAGANPGAMIDWVRVQHGDDPNDVTVLDDEAIIHTGLEIEVQQGVAAKVDDKVIEHATVQELYESLTEDQQELVHVLVAAALDAKQGEAAHSDDDSDKNKPDDKSDDTNDGEGDLEHKEGSGEMARNVFEQNANNKPEGYVLTHEDKKGIFADAAELGSMKKAVEKFALSHGIENIDTLFPDPRALTDRPEWNKRRTEWVAGVINGTKKTPFSRVKSLVADLTFEDARAKGYIKGNFKKEEFFSVSKRTTSPTTIYKKQKLDRDDILDITDFDVVAWLKLEMRMMLEEELARAILIGDGRDVSDEDKIKDPVGATDGTGIRSIANDHELYATTVNVNLDDASSSYKEFITAVIRARRFYKGTGTPTLYTTEQHLTEMLLLEDTQGRVLYETEAQLANKLRVSNIVTVEVMEDEPTIVGIIVNLNDYNIGADKGGEINFFDDFDIDYNQYKYLIETRVSGALTKIKSAIVIKKTASTNVLATPSEPAFNESTGVVTIPTVTGVVYKDGTAAGSTLTAGAQTALDPGETWHIVAVPASGYYFYSNAEDEWDFTRDEA